MPKTYILFRRDIYVYHTCIFTIKFVIEFLFLWCFLSSILGFPLQYLHTYNKWDGDPQGNQISETEGLANSSNTSSSSRGQELGF